MKINCKTNNCELLNYEEIKQTILSAAKELNVEVDSSGIEIDIEISGPLENNTKGIVMYEGATLFSFYGSVQYPINTIIHKSK